MEKRGGRSVWLEEREKNGKAHCFFFNPPKLNLLKINITKSEIKNFGLKFSYLSM